MAGTAAAKLTGGRVRVNIVSGKDDLAAYGDEESDATHRYDRNMQFMRLVRRLWTEENVSYDGRHFRVANSTAAHCCARRATAPETLFRRRIGGSGMRGRDGSRCSAVLGRATRGCERAHRAPDGAQRPPRSRSRSAFELGLRITTVVRDTSREAWAVAEAKVAQMAEQAGACWNEHDPPIAVGRRRLLDMQARGDVLDDNLYTAPGKYGAAGAGTTWLVGSAEEIAHALQNVAISAS